MRVGKPITPDAGLVRLKKALRPGPPADFKKHISANGRYILCVEDEPQVWTQSFDDRAVALV